MELICRGKPSLVEPLVVRLAMRFGLATAAITGWPTSDQYRILRLAQPGEGEAAGTPIAVIELQEIPGERTVLVLGSVTTPPPALEQYVQLLVQELMRFEFLARPDSPKGPIGFHLESGDEIEGARLLDSFDAINSVEIKPGPAPAPEAGTATSGSSPAGAPAPPPASDR